MVVLYLVLQYFGAGGRPVVGRGPGDGQLGVGGRGPGVGAGSRGSGGRKRAASINKVFSLAGGLSTGLSFYGV